MESILKNCYKLGYIFIGRLQTFFKKKCFITLINIKENFCMQRRQFIQTAAYEELTLK